MEQWRLIDSGYGDGAWNMALDEALMESVAGGDAPATLRFYGWRPPALSLGYFQTLEGIDREELRRRGFGLVRRPTGGRAILHHYEVTYSICIRQQELDNGTSVIGSYRELCQGLQEGLKLLGITSELASRRQHQPVGGVRRQGVANCFAIAMAGDLVAAGRKIVGSAQTRRNGAILQHGSVPIHIDAEAQAAIMPSLSGGAEYLQRMACGLAELLDREPSYDEVAQALAAGFEAAFGITLAASAPTDSERRRAQQLCREKYGTDQWNLNPPRHKPLPTP